MTVTREEYASGYLTWEGATCTRRPYELVRELSGGQVVARGLPSREPDNDVERYIVALGDADRAPGIGGVADMRPREFFRAVACRAIHSAWHMSHFVHGLVILVAGSSVFLGLRYGEHELIVLPFAALVAALLVGVLWHSFTLFREAEESHTARQASLQQRIDELETATAPPALSADAQRLLLGAAVTGSFYYFRTDDVGSLRVNGEEWLTDGAHRELKHWDAVLSELLRHGYVEAHSGHDGPIEVSDRGYAAIDRLRTVPASGPGSSSP